MQKDLVFFKKGVEKPLSPVAPHVLTEQEYYASLPIK